MRDARYVRLISWTLQSGSEQYMYPCIYIGSKTDMEWVRTRSQTGIEMDMDMNINHEHVHEWEQEHKLEHEYVHNKIHIHIANFFRKLNTGSAFSGSKRYESAGALAAKTEAEKRYKKGLKSYHRA